MKKFELAAIAMTTLLVGCLAQPSSAVQARPDGVDPLIGCYAQSEGGNATLRVAKQGSEYFLVSLTETEPREEWLQLFPLTDAQLSTFPSKDGLKVEAGLRAKLGVIAVFKFGANGNGASDDDSNMYFFFAPQVGGELFQRGCPNEAVGA